MSVRVSHRVTCHHLVGQRLRMTPTLACLASSTNIQQRSAKNGVRSSIAAVICGMSGEYPSQPLLRVSLGPNLHADLGFRTIRPLEYKGILTHESRAWIPVENATLETRSDWELGTLAVD